MGRDFFLLHPCHPPPKKDRLDSEKVVCENLGFHEVLWVESCVLLFPDINQNIGYISA